ncbi:MAG: hypothetical protein J6E44_04145 [Lachnospiraceae bacterium]|nr:hypothetical protein [Lachnospiraceae bacterium]
MKNSSRVFTVLLLILMAGFAVLFPAALFLGLSYDAITAVLLILLVIALTALHFDEKTGKGGES